MDCFYAAIECRDDPGIAHLPVGVGGSSGRGVLTTCNYPAREFGCRSAMPVFKAKQLCPHLILKPVRFDVYRQESRRIRKIFRDYTEQIEPLSLDEAYLDVSHQQRYAWEIAREIRSRIRSETGLTASAGIAENKMLAKIASDWKKPDGQFVILPKEVEDFMRALPVRKIPGIGPKAEEKLKSHAVHTCGDLQAIEATTLESWFGPAWAAEILDRARGIDDRPVEVNRVRKSLSVERTFAQDIRELEACRETLKSILKEMREDLEKSEPDRAFRSVFVKLKFANFQTTTKETRSHIISEAVVAPLLEEAFHRSPHAVRLMGVGVRFPEDPGDDPQLELPFDE